jgi:hypothetical protein
MIEMAVTPSASYGGRNLNRNGALIGTADAARAEGRARMGQGVMFRRAGRGSGMRSRLGNLAILAASAFALAAVGCSPSPARTAAPSVASSTLGATLPSTASPNTPPGDGRPATTTGGCTLPVTQDPYDGFHIAVPAGWNLFTLSGTVWCRGMRLALKRR